MDLHDKRLVSVVCNEGTCKFNSWNTKHYDGDSNKDKVCMLKQIKIGGMGHKCWSYQHRDSKNDEVITDEEIIGHITQRLKGFQDG